MEGTTESPLRTEPQGKIRGITISTHTSNRGWETDELGATFADVAAVGANWVAIHPYARIAAEGEVSFRPFDSEVSKAGGEGAAAAGPRYLRHPIEEAHRLGLKILIKPHLAYWGSPFSWRGDIELDTEEEWARFFATYEAWIVAVAKASADADGLVVGTELDRTVHRPEWSDILARLREVSDVPMTYAANWSDYQKVPFWGALDVIGIQAYFPIAGDWPTDHELAQGWQRRMGELRRFAHGVEKSILFTELGYSRSGRAASEPWDPGERSRRGGPFGTRSLEESASPRSPAATLEPDPPDLAAEALQRRCLAAALSAIESEPLVSGAFLWKWFPRPHSVGRDFEMAAPAIQEVIRTHWVEASNVAAQKVTAVAGSPNEQP